MEPKCWRCRGWRPAMACYCADLRRARALGVTVSDLRYGARDALTILDAARARYSHAAAMRDRWTVGDPADAMARARADMRAARRSLRELGASIPARRLTRHARHV